MATKKTSYDDAIREIEEILSQIEAGNLGVDALAGKVSRATALIKLCRDRLYKTEQQIGQILDEGDRAV